MVDGDPDRLVTDASRGDAEALDELLERHLPLARVFARRKMTEILRSREESWDIVQSVCRRVLEKRDRYEHRNDVGFQGWLLEVVDRKVIDRYRELTTAKRDVGREVVGAEGPSRDGAALVDAIAASADLPATTAARNEAANRVREAIAALPEDLGRALSLHHFEGLPYSAIADREGISLKQARWRVYRAKTQLATALREAESDESRG